MARIQSKKDQYQKQREEIMAAKEELYSNLGKVVIKGLAEVGGREKFLSYLGDVSKEMSGLEIRYGSLKLGKDSYNEARKLVAQIGKIERAANQKNEPAWLKMAKSIYTRYEKRKED